MGRNRKVKNATAIEFDGIKFKSKLECNFYKKLLEAGFKPQYEKKSYLLWNGLKPTIPFYTRDKKTKLLKLDMTKLRDMTYTPDFTFNYNGRFIIIEAKGKENDTYPIKRKLFRGLLEGMTHNNPLFFEVFSQKQLQEVINIIKSYDINREDTEAITQSTKEGYPNCKETPG